MSVRITFTLSSLVILSEFDSPKSDALSNIGSPRALGAVKST